jgi:hypothetical protein
MPRCWACRILDRARSPLFVKRWACRHAMVSDPRAKSRLIADVTIPHWGVLCVCAMPAMAFGEFDAYGYDLRRRRQGLRSSRDPDVKHLEGSYFRRRIPANGFTYSVDSEVILRHAHSFQNMQTGNRMRRQRR